MLRCISCGREYPDDYDVNLGCKCGAKVFILLTNDAGTVGEYEVKENKIKQDDVETIENIKIKEPGVFEINLDRLLSDPIIIKDENEIYYIRLPVKDAKEE